MIKDYFLMFLGWRDGGQQLGAGKNRPDFAHFGLAVDPNAKNPAIRSLRTNHGTTKFSLSVC